MCKNKQTNKKQEKRQKLDIRQNGSEKTGMMQG